MGVMPKRAPTPPRRWQPMQRGVAIPIPPERRRAMEAILRERGADVNVDALLEPGEMWLNDRYVVGVERRDDGAVSVLSVRRQDRKPLRDWRDLQRIKNDIAGDDVEAVELFPAEDRLMDTANQYWLWCLSPGNRWPFGFNERQLFDPADAERVGAKQRAHA